MKQNNNDPVAALVFKLMLVFVTAIIAIYILPLCVGLLGVTGSTGNALMDVFFFKLMPIFIAFIIIYKAFKIFTM